MAFLHLGPLQFELLRGPFARQVIPPIGQKDAAYIQKCA
jgi:hypothetical protein